MKVNLEFYRDVETQATDIENEICEYINKSENNQYKYIIEKDERIQILYALSGIRKNIINWYPFEKDSNILEINADFGEITEELCNKIDKVVTIERKKIKAQAIEKRLQEKENLEVIVGELKDINFQQKFDYILINGIEEHSNSLEEYIQFAQKYIQENGTILFTTDNKFGLKTYNIDCVNMEKKRYISQQKIEEILKNYNFKDYKFYYPLPNYKTPNVIFTDKHKPSQESILRDLTLYDKNEILVHDERKKYKEIIKEYPDLFSIFANSYLVEISNKDNDIEFISFGNSRKERYRMKTIMLDNIVYKQNVEVEGQAHIEQIKSNIDILKQADINILDKYEDGKIVSKLIREEKSLDKVLIKKYEEGKYTEFIDIVEKFIKEIYDKLEKQDDKTKTIFEQYEIKIDKETKEKLTYVKYGIYDLIFQNCFYIDEKFYFYDQEWVENNIPLEFIIYRAINYLCNSKNEIDRNKLYEHFQINEYISIFEELENILQENIKDSFIWKIHACNNTTIKNVYDTKVHYGNLKTLAEQAIEKERENVNEQIRIRDNKINELTNELNYIKNSKSWKMTKVLRTIRRNFNSERNENNNGTKKEIKR